MLDAIAALLNPRALKGFVGYFFGPDQKNPWGGPFNGQIHRLKMFQEINDIYRFETAFETGTYRGTTTELLSKKIGGKVWTVELDAWNYGYCAARFLLRKNVSLLFGDSRDAIGRCANQFDNSSPIFFYLDAHWGSDLPLLTELNLIFNNWPDSVVMIDDFKVHDDVDYGFDDYGGGSCLCIDYIAPVVRKFRPRTFLPSIAGKDETGARRGSIVLTGAEAKAPISMSTIREFRLGDT